MVGFFFFFFSCLVVWGRGERELVGKMDVLILVSGWSLPVPFIRCMTIPAGSMEVPGVIRSAAIKCYFVHNEKHFFFLLVNFSHYWAGQNGWRFLLKLFLLLYNFDSDIKWFFTGSAEPSGAFWVLNGVLCSVTSNNNWRLLIQALPVVSLVMVSFLLSSFESCTFLPSAL